MKVTKCTISTANKQVGRAGCIHSSVYTYMIHGPDNPCIFKAIFLYDDALTPHFSLLSCYMPASIGKFFL